MAVAWPLVRVPAAAAVRGSSCPLLPVAARGRQSAAGWMYLDLRRVGLGGHGFGGVWEWERRRGDEKQAVRVSVRAVARAVFSPGLAEGGCGSGARGGGGAGPRVRPAAAGSLARARACGPLASGLELSRSAGPRSSARSDRRPPPPRLLARASQSVSPPAHPAYPPGPHPNPKAATLTSTGLRSPSLCAQCRSSSSTRDREPTSLAHTANRPRRSLTLILCRFFTGSSATSA